MYLELEISARIGSFQAWRSRVRTAQGSENVPAGSLG
jgi:hypothetical protein